MVPEAHRTRLLRNGVVYRSKFRIFTNIIKVLGVVKFRDIYLSAEQFFLGGATL